MLLVVTSSCPVKVLVNLFVEKLHTLPDTVNPVYPDVLVQSPIILLLTTPSSSPPIGPSFLLNHKYRLEKVVDPKKFLVKAILYLFSIASITFIHFIAGFTSVQANPWLSEGAELLWYKLPLNWGKLFKES